MRVIKVFGVAGAGKTTECLNIVLELIGMRHRRKVLEDLSPYEAKDICFSSFTKAALESILRKLEQQDITLPEDHSFRTLHSLTWRMASYGGSEMRKSDTNKYFRSVGIRTQRTIESQESESEQIIQFYERLINHLAKPIEAITRAEMNAMYYDMRQGDAEGSLDFNSLQDQVVKFSGWKDTSGKHSYVDSILYCFHKKIPLGRKVLIIDECQDLNYLQTELVRMWSEKVDLVILAGDDDQTVHEWMGATPHFFIEYKKDITEKIILDKSYRVPENAGRMANKVLQGIRFREEKTIHSNLPPHKIAYLNEDYTFIRKIEDAAKKNNHLKEKTYVLCRTKRIRNRISSSFFDFSDVPFAFIGENGRYTVKFKELCNSLNKLQRKENLLPTEASRLFACLPADVCLYRGARREVLGCPDKEFTPDWVLSKTRLWNTNLTRFFEPVVADSPEQGCHNLKASILPYVRYSGRFLTNEQDVVLEDDRMRSKLGRISDTLPYDEDIETGLQFGTFHSSKGLEAGTVFVCLGTNNYFCNIDDTEHRCFYVAITRTKGELFLVAPGPGDAMWLSDVFWPIVAEFAH